MEVLYQGHRYALSNLRDLDDQILQFQQDAPLHTPAAGTSCQEVIRALIDRVNFLHEERPWKRNEDIVYHLRMSLTLFEARALERKAEKGVQIERMATHFDGHLKLERKD